MRLYPLTLCALSVLLAACGSSAENPEPTATTNAPLQIAVSPHSVAYDFADLPSIPAGVAGDSNVVFVGDPLEGQVLALSRLDGKSIGTLPQPPQGFILPFIMHSLGEGLVAVLDAGGLPEPNPFVPANPTIYEYRYSYGPRAGFEATLVRTVSFSSVEIGFSEDFTPLPDGRILLSDARLGAIWIAEPDGTIKPGIVPKSLSPSDAIPQLYFCPTMPEVKVNGFPFLFSGSSNPGVSPIAVRNGTVYFFSPCARGIYTFPLSVLSDSRPAYARASSIRLLASTPANIQVEELLDFTFNPYNPADPYLYAAEPLQLNILRIDPNNGKREVIASGAKLFDFPSSMAFLPPVLGIEPLMVVSNQQERTPLTNDAVTTDQFNLPFIVAKVIVTD